MRILKTLAVLALAAIAFAGGYAFHARRAPGAPAAETSRRILYYVDPMHPAYRSDKPGIAPDCGMTLEPVYADNAPAADGTAAAAPPGTIRIAPDRQQLIGVRFTTVSREGGTREVRTVGKVTYDERRIAHVHTRFEGWVEKVFVDFVGAVVRKGEPLFTTYSPEMLASQEELLLAAKARDLMAGSPLPGAPRQGASLFGAAKRRLELWDLGDAQLARVLETGVPIRNITVPAPASGYVTARNVYPKQKIGPADELYTIADLSRVWVLADVFETDIALVRIGQAVRVTLPFADEAPRRARVDYIQPAVDPTTRTLKVRLDVANPGTRLKPDMFVNVDFAFPQSPRLVVPLDAVLDSGTRQVVFVDRGNGYLEPRAVTVGAHVGDRVVISSGLREGERIVAAGTFLVDSESQLKAAVAAIGASAPDAPSGSAPEHQHD